MSRKSNRLHKRPIGYKKGHDPTGWLVIFSGDPEKNDSFMGLGTIGQISKYLRFHCG